MKKIIFYGLCVWWCACKQPPQEVIIPDTILPKEKMASVVAQIHLAEAKANLSLTPDVVLNTKINFEDLLQKNKISRALYDSSLVFYVNHPALFNEVYEKAINELSQKQTTVIKNP